MSQSFRRLAATLLASFVSAACFAEEAPAAPSPGQTQFIMNCSACHQATGLGLIGMAPSIRNPDFLSLADDAFIKETVLKGRAGTLMVPRPDLEGENLDMIVAWLREAATGPVTVDKTKEYPAGDAAKGAELFKTNCASCHGATGGGYMASTPELPLQGTGIGLPGFIHSVSDDYIIQTLKTGRTGTPMKKFIGAAEGDPAITEIEALDIIAYLRSLTPKPEQAAE